MTCGSPQNSKKEIPMSKPCIVFQSDFGISTGLPASMTAVAARIDPELRLYDLCHEVRQFDIRMGGSTKE